jgi:uncharacterized protein
VRVHPPGERLTAFSEYVDTACRDCAHIRYCRGGCPYNAIAPSGGSLEGVDPHCVAYKRIFDELSERLNREMFEEPMPGFGGPVSRKLKKPGVMALMRSVVNR